MRELINQYDNVIIVHSFTKFYAVPGLRIGAVFANPTLIQELRQYIPAWSVNTLAQAYTESALTDTKYINDSKMVLANEAKYMYESLSAIKDLVVYKPSANYILMEINNPDITVTDVQTRLEKHNLLIGEKSAEDIKIKIGTVDPEEEELQIEVSGKYVLNGLPKDITLTSSELIETLSALVQEIIEEIRVIFEKTPPELAADIKKKGIYISGGGALLRGIDKKIASGLNLKVTVAEDPLNAVINGIGVLLNDFSTYSRVLVSTETEY